MGEENMVTNQINQEFQQRDHIATSEKRNIFIEAGAGAGKSTSLVDRTYYSLAETVEANRIRKEASEGKSKAEIIKELSDFTGCTDKEIAFRKKLIAEIDDIIAGNVNLIKAKDIYAITFTNKATEELRNKIVAKLQDYKDCTKEEIWRKGEVLKDVDNIHISTIHKFCEDILKENAIKAGLSPNFAPIIDQEEQDVKDRVIRKYFRNFQHWAIFEKYEPLGLKRSDIKDALAGKSGVLNSLLSTADRINKKQIYRCKSFRGDGLADFRTAIEELLDGVDCFICDNPRKGGKPFAAKAILNNRGYEYGQSDDDRKTAIEKIMSISENEWYKELEENSIIISRPPEDLKDDIRDAFEPLIKEVIQKRNNVFIGIAQLYIDYGYELYEEYLNDRDNDVEKLTSNDLVYKAYELLKNNPDVLNKTSQKIKRLFIDEYQDTDSLQYEIASMIAGSRSDVLYIVGDPKQSIYRFRGAEPDVFFNTKDEFANDLSNHALYDLNINFRSNSKIIEWVNKRYSNIDLIESSVGYSYQPMIYHPDNEIKQADADDPNKLTGFYHFDKVGTKDIKDLILYLKNNYLVREKGTYRKVRYKDIMVLTEGHWAMPIFVEEFTKNNIPSRVYGESRFFNTLAVRAFLALYEAILVDADASLAEVEAVYYNLQPSLFAGKTHSESRKLVQGLLNNLRKKTMTMDAYGKAIYLVEHMSLLMKDKHIYQDFEVNFAASKIYQTIEAIFSKGFFNGNELIEEFKKYLSQSIERESLIQDDIDAVMLINLHKAKGLEAPIVIWVSTNTSDKNADGISDAYKKKVLFPSIITNYVRKSQTLKGEVAHLKADEDYEVARKEYVAVTRPGEAYIFADTSENTSMFHSSKRQYNLEDEDVEEISLPEPEPIEEDEEELVAEEEQSSEQENEEEVQEEPVVVKTNEDLEENATEDIPYYQGEKDYSFNKDTSLPKSISPSSLEASSSPTREKCRQEAGELPPSNRPKSNDVGTILHRALELLIKEELSSEEAVKYAINENIDLIPSDDNGGFEQFFITCVNSFNEWFKAEGYELYPEFGFSYFEDGQIKNGSIDLLMVKDNECVIIDYKSDEAEYIEDDAIFETTLVEKYENQLNAYEQVVATLFPNRAISKKIIYFRRYDDQNHTIDVKCLDL